MKVYKMIDHPADLKLKIFGKTLGDLFCNLVRAIASEQAGPSASLREPACSDVVTSGRQARLRSVAGGENIEVKSPDLFSLLVDFASEIIYRSDVSGKIYTDCKIIELVYESSRSWTFVSPCKVKALVSGVRMNKKLDIKAATYHDGYVKKAGGRWEAVILFDI